MEVIIHKAKDAGPNRLVEDTSLNVEGSDIGVNIRWMLDNLNKLSGKKANWIVLLGLNTGDNIKVFKGEVPGHLINPKTLPKKIFGFDPYFVPSKNNNGKTLEELELDGKKDIFSARKLAANNFLKDKYERLIPINTIPKWTGRYQN